MKASKRVYKVSCRGKVFLMILAPRPRIRINRRK